MPTRHCVMIPFLGRHGQVARCLAALLPQANPDTVFLLVDDGSRPSAQHSPALQPFLKNPRVHLIHHRENCGVAAARNSGIHWCRHHHIDIAIMIDSDCVAENNVIAEHLRLHREHPEAACIGAAIVGRGKSLWARLDGTTSWIHASAHGRQTLNLEDASAEFRQVEAPYHLATTNFSVKLASLPQRDFVFDERLYTGEDCLLVRELRKQGQGVYFSATPKILHQDRENFRDVFKHHYVWGHHQYFIQLGGDISPRCFNPLYRGLFVLVFLPLLPLFALAGSLLNSKALWVNRRQDLWLYPLIYLLWLGKGIAVLEAAIHPAACLRASRPSVTYAEVKLHG